jgi:hypothetical protein
MQAWPRTLSAPIVETRFAPLLRGRSVAEIDETR